MKILIIILVYIVGVFVARWSNRELRKRDDDINLLTYLWLCSWATVVASIVVLIVIKDPLKPKSNWFTGKYW